MKPSARLTPYVLLGVLTLGAGLGVGLGLSEAPSASTTFTVLVPADSSSSGSVNEYAFAVPVGTTCHESRREAAGTLTLWVCTRPG